MERKTAVRGLCRRHSRAWAPLLPPGSIAAALVRIRVWGVFGRHQAGGALIAEDLCWRRKSLVLQRGCARPRLRNAERADASRWLASWCDSFHIVNIEKDSMEVASPRLADLRVLAINPAAPSEYKERRCPRDFRRSSARWLPRIFRRQLDVARRPSPCGGRRQHRCLVLVGLYRLFSSVLAALKIFQPEAVIRWHRVDFRGYWRWEIKTARRSAEDSAGTFASSLAR